MRAALLGAPLLLTLACGGDDSPPPPTGEPVTVKVMTRNLFLGADLLPVVTVQTVEEIPPQVASLWQTMQRTDLPGRAKLLAAEIAAARPDLVGLQEAVVFYKQVPSDFSFAAPKTNAATVEHDFIKLVQSELVALGAEYEVAATLDNSDVELPAADAAAPFDVRMTDRIGILARKGVQVTGKQSSHYTAHVPFTIPIGVTMGAPVDLIRGVLRVDAVVDGAAFTFVNTQLEVSGGPNDILSAYQEMQAMDLLRVLEPIPGPLVVVGDFNSAAEPPKKAYMTVAAKLSDAAAQAGAPANTCCLDVLAPVAPPTQRIDFVFHRGGIATQAVEVVGTAPDKRTPEGLAPSRHAGVVATLKIPRAR
jgi:endonuclease/exonuclease/phosphatase family metal-dependent hydrolase